MKIISLTKKYEGKKNDLIINLFIYFFESIEFLNEKKSKIHK